MASKYRTILLDGCPNIKEDVSAAGSAIKPGHLIRRLASGSNPVVNVHNVAGGSAALYFATENVLLNGGTVDDAYAAADIVRYHQAKPGDIVAVRIKANSGNITYGTKLYSAGDGTFVTSAELTAPYTNGSAAGAADLAALKVVTEAIGDALNAGVGAGTAILEADDILATDDEEMVIAARVL